MAGGSWWHDSSGFTAPGGVVVSTLATMNGYAAMLPCAPLKKQRVDADARQPCTCAPEQTLATGLSQLQTGMGCVPVQLALPV